MRQILCDGCEKVIEREDQIRSLVYSSYGERRLEMCSYECIIDRCKSLIRDYEKFLSTLGVKSK